MGAEWFKKNQGQGRKRLRFVMFSHLLGFGIEGHLFSAMPYERFCSSGIS
jgi:hypothetical protein